MALSAFSDSPTHDSKSRKKKGFSWGKFFLIIVLLAMIGGLAGLGYLYYETRQELKYLASPAGQEELARREVENVVDALSKLAILPEEEPVIATITDATALATESAFYTNAQNGDKLVVFPTAQQAFIYSPGRNKIVNVGPLLIEEAPVGENANGATESIGAGTGTDPEETVEDPTAPADTSEESTLPEETEE